MPDMKAAASEHNAINRLAAETSKLTIDQADELIPAAPGGAELMGSGKRPFHLMAILHPFTATIRRYHPDVPEVIMPPVQARSTRTLAYVAPPQWLSGGETLHEIGLVADVAACLLQDEARMAPESLAIAGPPTQVHE